MADFRHLFALNNLWGNKISDARVAGPAGRAFMGIADTPPGNVVRSGGASAVERSGAGVTLLLMTL
jgi:hypothetical protein